jgi:hypothetical protein
VLAPASGLVDPDLSRREDRQQGRVMGEDAELTVEAPALDEVGITLEEGTFDADHADRDGHRLPD